MSNPTTIEAAVEGVVNRLKAVGVTLDVQAFPDDPDKYRLMHPIGAALVAYRGADHTPLDTDDGSTRRAMHVDVHVIGTALNGPKGITPQFDAVRAALAGYRIPGFGKITPVAERFVGRVETRWTFALTVGMTTLAIASADEEPAGVPLARITMNPTTDPLEIPS